jgi:hypothetical protein
LSLLSIIQSVCAELSIPIPSLVVANTDPTIAQLRYLCQRAGDDLARDYDWSDLHMLRSFTTTGAYPSRPLCRPTGRSSSIIRQSGTIPASGS